MRPEASELALTRLEADGKIVFADELVHRHDFTPTLDPEAEVAVKRIRRKKRRPKRRRKKLKRGVIAENGSAMASGAVRT